MTAAALIRSARLNAGLTQAQLATRLGTTQPAIAKLERRGSNPAVATLDRLLRATGHTLKLSVEPHTSSIDQSLIRKQLELSPLERLRGVERMYAEGTMLAAAGARALARS